MKHLATDAKVDETGVHIAGMHYKAVVLDGLNNIPENAVPALRKLSENGRLIIYEKSPFSSLFPKTVIAGNQHQLVETVGKLVEKDIELYPTSNSIRYRHVIKGGKHYYIIFNEEESVVKTKFNVSADGEKWWLDEYSAEAKPVTVGIPVVLQPHELKILMVEE